MDAAFSGSNLKLLSAALSCLGRFGEDVALFAQAGVASQRQETYLRLSVINASASAICQVFLPPLFFTSFALAPSQKALNAKLPIRTLHSCLRIRASDHRLLSCALSTESDRGEAKLVVVLRYVQQLEIKHNIPYSPEQGLVPTAEAGPHCIRLSHGTAKAWAQQLLAVPTAVGPNGAQSHKVGEVTFYVSPEVCDLQVHHEELPTATHRKLPTSSKTGISTSVTMEPDAFTKYRISREELLTFPLKEFKAGLQLADQLMVGIELRFSMGGEPLFVTIRHASGIKVVVVLATSTYSVIELDQNRKNPNVPGRSPPAKMPDESDDEDASLFGPSHVSTQLGVSRHYSTTPLDDQPLTGTRATSELRKGPNASLRETPRESTPRDARPAPGPFTSFDTRGPEGHGGDGDEAIQDEPLFRGMSQPSSQPLLVEEQSNPVHDADETQPLFEGSRAERGNQDVLAPPPSKRQRTSQPMTLAAASSHDSNTPAYPPHSPTSGPADPNSPGRAEDAPLPGALDDNLLDVDLDALTRAVNPGSHTRRPRPRPRIRSNPALHQRVDSMPPPTSPARAEGRPSDPRESQGESLSSQRQQDFAQVTVRGHVPSSSPLEPELDQWVPARSEPQPGGSAPGGVLGPDEPDILDVAGDGMGEDGDADMTLPDTQLGPTPIPASYQPRFGP